MPEEIFDSLADARRKLALWRYDYNNVRPHSSLGNKTPSDARRALEQSEDSAPGALATPKPTNINPKDSRYERGTTGGQVKGNVLQTVSVWRCMDADLVGGAGELIDGRWQHGRVRHQPRQAEDAG